MRRVQSKGGYGRIDKIEIHYSIIVIPRSCATRNLILHNAFLPRNEIPRVLQSPRAERGANAPSAVEGRVFPTD
jgi:hypothetical protein